MPVQLRAPHRQRLAVRGHGAPLADPIARQASLHTWDAYHQTLHEQVFQTPWADLLARLDAADVAVQLVWGDHDPVGDRALATAASEHLPHVNVSVVVGDHTLPAARPRLAVDLLHQA